MTLYICNMAGDLTPYICNMAGVLLKAKLLTLREHLSFHLRCFGGVRVAHLFSCFVLSYDMSLRSEFRVVISSDIHIEDTKGAIRGYQRGYQKIPKGLSKDTKGAIRRYQRGYQKKPKGLSEDTKGAIRRYKRGYQKIPKGLSEDTKRAIRRYKRGYQKIPKELSEDTKGAIRR